MPVGEAFQDLRVGTINVLVRKRFGEGEERLADVPLKRFKRWDRVNRELLAIIDKTNEADTGYKNKRMKTSVAYSSLTWDKVKVIYEPRFDYLYRIQYDSVPKESLDFLETVFKMKQAVYSENSADKEAKRSFFIEPIFLAVANLFDPPMSIEIEEQVNGKYVTANGNLDFVLKSKMDSGRYQRICIVEAKRTDMHKGMAQNLVAMEVVSEIEEKETVYGIVTNFKEWTFLKLSDDKIGIDEDELNLGKGIRDEVGRIAAKLFAILSEQ